MGPSSSRPHAALVLPNRLQSNTKGIKLFPNNFQIAQLYPRRQFSTVHRNTKCIYTYPAFNPVNFTMSGIQLKITMHAKKQENMPHNKEKSQSVETDAQINKNIKTAIINILHMFRNTGKNEHVKGRYKKCERPKSDFQK